MIDGCVKGRQASPPPPRLVVAQGWNASEGVYAFCSWLSTRKDRTVISATDGAADVVALIEEWRARHALALPREGWERGIIS